MFNKNEFMAAIARKGVTLGDVANDLKINRATLHRKIVRDGDFRRSEINELIDYLDISDPKRIFFADELAET